MYRYLEALNQDGSRYLEEIDPPPREENWLVICGPEGTGEPILTPTHVAFNGDASTRKDYAPFLLSLEDLEQAPFWCDCKTGQEPYSNLVICALARFCHYFPETAIWNDEGEKPMAIAAAICKQIFGENRSPQPWDKA